MMTKKIAVLGAGSWGSILANVLVENGHDVTLYSNSSAVAEEINQKHTNEHYLKDVTFPTNLTATTNMAQAVAGAEMILFVVPTKATRSVAHELNQILTTAKQKPLIVHASKGLELGSHKRLSQVLAEEIAPQNRQGIAVLSGPSHAEEVARKDITLITAAASDLANAKEVQSLFMNDYFRVYTNIDVVGVEMGAAFKNIIAIGAGALHGLGYGDNAKAALMTRGLAEISRLGLAFGADPLTFIGLSGVGDLIVTCTSVHSRNWRTGNALGQGKPLSQIEAEMGMVIEGVNTCKAAYELAAQQGIEMPITEAIYNVIYQGHDIKPEIAALMQREGKSELN